MLHSKLQSWQHLSRTNRKDPRHSTRSHKLTFQSNFTAPEQKNLKGNSTMQLWKQGTCSTTIMHLIYSTYPYKDMVILSNVYFNAFAFKVCSQNFYEWNNMTWDQNFFASERKSIELWICLPSHILFPSPCPLSGFRINYYIYIYK